jgi:hypothetical protein
MVVSISFFFAYCTFFKQEIHQMAIQSLAEITAYITEYWRRVGQQLLILDSASVSSLQSIADELAR